MVRFLSRLKQYRLRAVISQEELAEIIGVKRLTITRLESSMVQPSFEIAYKLAKYFSLHIEDLFTFVDNKANINRNKTIPRMHPSRTRRAHERRLSS